MKGILKLSRRKQPETARGNPNPTPERKATYNKTEKRIAGSRGENKMDSSKGTF